LVDVYSSWVTDVLRCCSSAGLREQLTMRQYEPLDGTTHSQEKKEDKGSRP
jgi:hypothetical protein